MSSTKNKKVSKVKKLLLLFTGIFLLFVLGFFAYKKVNLNPFYSVGEEVDSLDGVKVYHNGGLDHVAGRNLTPGSYNLGLKYQCVEFVKRYYYQHFGHKMPDTYGHARDFFQVGLADGDMNRQRSLLQFSNPSQSCPEAGDILVFAGSLFNPYGHVAIVAEVGSNYVQVIQQNPGALGSTRASFFLQKEEGAWEIFSTGLLGWLRMPPHSD